ncbi:MAG TPA: TetR/AcrR family transcriptional regulator [Candidatus Eisenbacteria bacterium]|nr:TetR/AcrR family transcriptional regulator [Candidatus Eisenbacteria bacterium]
MKKERTRQVIAETALRLFTERGYEHTTIEEIASQAEVGTRTLYRYYPTKEDLVVGTTRPGLRHLVDGLRARPDDEPLPRALHAILTRFCYILTAERERGLVLRELIESVPSVRARVYDEIGHTRADLAREIRRRLGSPRGDPTPELAAGVVMVVVDLAVVTWAAGRRSPQRVVEEAIELLSSGAVPVPAADVHGPG